MPGKHSKSFQCSWNCLVKFFRTPKTGNLVSFLIKLWRPKNVFFILRRERRATLKLLNFKTKKVLKNFDFYLSHWQFVLFKQFPRPLCATKPILIRFLKWLKIEKCNFKFCCCFLQVLVKNVIGRNLQFEQLKLRSYAILPAYIVLRIFSKSNRRICRVGN